MKKFLLLLPLLSALALPTSVEANWFGKYNSRYEAKEACKKWVFKGFKYEYENSYGNKFDGYSRRCSLEADTNQILGFETKGVNRKFYSAILYRQELRQLKEKVVKNFKF